MVQKILNLKFFLIIFTDENKKNHHQLGKNGTKNGRAKLTEQDVILIRQKHQDGITNQEIYKLFPNITPTSIRNVINKKTWTHLL